MMPRPLRSIAFAAGLVGLAISGCGQPSQDPQVLAIRDQYVVADEPAGALTLTQLAQRLEAPAAQADPEAEAGETTEAAAATPESAVVVGRIFAGDLEPWEPGKASFLLAELPAEGHGDNHDADNCPFCKRRAAQAPTAIVQFLDERGQVIGHDARQLFDVQKNDVVTVRGQAVRGELNTLVLTAEAIHVRRK